MASLVESWARFRLTKTPPALVLDTTDPIKLQGTKPERAHLAAIVAREAVVAGVLAEYESAWLLATRLLRASLPAQSPEQHVSAWMKLAAAAQEARDWERAIDAAHEALGTASDAGLAEAAAAAAALGNALWRDSDRKPPNRT